MTTIHTVKGKWHKTTRRAYIDNAIQQRITESLETGDSLFSLETEARKAWEQAQYFGAVKAVTEHTGIPDGRNDFKRDSSQLKQMEYAFCKAYIAEFKARMRNMSTQKKWLLGLPGGEHGSNRVFTSASGTIQVYRHIDRYGAESIRIEVKRYFGGVPTVKIAMLYNDNEAEFVVEQLQHLLSKEQS